MYYAIPAMAPVSANLAQVRGLPAETRAAARARSPIGRDFPEHSKPVAPPGFS